MATVASGAVTIAGPQPVTVPAGVQASIAGGRVTAQRRVSPAELQRITAWRRNFAFAPPRQPAYPTPTPSYPPSTPTYPPSQPYPTQPYPTPQPYPGQYYPFPIPSIPWRPRRRKPPARR